MGIAAISSRVFRRFTLQPSPNNKRINFQKRCRPGTKRRQQVYAKRPLASRDFLEPAQDGRPCGSGELRRLKRASTGAWPVRGQREQYQTPEQLTSARGELSLDAAKLHVDIWQHGSSEGWNSQAERIAAHGGRLRRRFRGWQVQRLVDEVGFQLEFGWHLK